jgi:hypothetical protein
MTALILLVEHSFDRLRTQDAGKAEGPKLPVMTQPADLPPEDARYAALGQLVELAAVMEIALRMAFCVLVGGSYAALVAAAQETYWLIESCDAITRHRDDLSEAQRGTIRAALRACREANHHRNRLVHDAWGTGADGGPALLRGGQGSYEINGRAWTTAQIRAGADSVASAQCALLGAIEQAFGTGSVRTAEQQLAAHAAERGR